ncbi:lytic transglycosylase domain-containing protein [Serratia marcescens]|uniref:lytic transglycosylase domain-containing protein n=1 Tax=Serratia marcescens TaxID=615 RepID=UPI0011CA8165|nr:lytic transglycosylase domain-containing protein [Serratia marcescens]TXE41429.1 lytic transglycosylase domain-containing protein [Serratia marcescens]
MAGPWEKYQNAAPAESPSDGPWTKYQQPQQSPPQQGGDVVSDAEQRFGIPAGLLGAVISKESSGNANAMSGKGAIGLTQVMPNTARGMGYDPEELKRNPAMQVEAGARYLKQMIDAHDGNVSAALAAYNWGPGNVQKYLRGEKTQVPTETVNYVNDPRFAQWTQQAAPGSDDELAQLAQQSAQPWAQQAPAPTASQNIEQAARGLANIPFDILQGGANLVNAGSRAVGGGDVLAPVYRPVSRPTDPYAQAGEAIGNYLTPGVGPVAGAMIGSIANAGNEQGDFASNASKEMLLNAALMGAPAIYRGVRGLIQGGRGGAEQAAAGADNLASAVTSQADSVAGTKEGAQSVPTPSYSATIRNIPQQAAQDATPTEEAIRSLAAQRDPNLASSLDGLNINTQQDVADAAGRLGVESLLPSHLSGNSQYQAVEQALKSRPGSALKVQEDKAIGELASGAGRIIDDVAGAPDALGMSENYISQINGRMAALQRRSDQLYGRVDKAMAPGTRIEAPNTASVLEREADNLGGWENLDSIEKSVFKAVNPGQDGVLTYANLNKQRRLVGEALQKNSGPYKDADRAALSRLYSSLAEDQKAALSGTDSLRDFEVAQRLVQMRKTMENQMVNLRGKTLNGDVTYKATTALQSLSKGNAKGFRELMENTPSRGLRSELIGTALRDMLSSGKRGADFNPAGFADWWQNMQASGQIRTLSQHLPKETMAGLNDVYKIARAIKNAKAYEITTGRLNEFIDRFNRVTATHEMAARHAQKIGTMIGAYGGPVGALAGSEMGVRIAERARAAGGAGSAEAADKLISSPEFQRAIKSLPAKAPEHVADSRIRKSPGWREFFDNLPEEEKRTIARLGIVRWLMQGQEEY